MNLKKKLFQQKLFRINKRIKPYQAELDHAQSLSNEELSAFNWSRRQQLVEFCASHIPFYQRTFKEAGFEPGDLKSEADFAQLPILEKEEIREYQSELFNPACDESKLNISTTGGSTGSPLVTFSDPNIPVSTVCWRTLRWWGVEPSDNAGYLYRAIPQGYKRVIQDIVMWPTRRRYIHPSSMDEASMKQFHAKLRSISAQYILGYVGALDVFITFLDRNNLDLPSLKAVWTTAAPLPELKRKYMEKVVGCPVYTQYGSCEFYWIAAECKEQQGLHIASDIRHVDVVDHNQPVENGTSGDLLVTNLIDYSFPLLRYRLGDRGCLLDTPCQCGLPFPMMDYVKGRISDSIHLRDGTIIPGEYWTTIFDDCVDTIKSFRVWQKKDLSIEVQFEPFGEDYSVVIESVSKMLNKKLSGKADLTFVRTTIDVNDQGKTRFVQSDVQ